VHNGVMADLTDEIAASAAQCVVEEGLEYGPAKRRALKMLGLPPRTPLPNNDQVEAQVHEYIALFCADTQAAELLALRQHALMWMKRLQDFRPYLGGRCGMARPPGCQTFTCSCFAMMRNRVKLSSSTRVLTLKRERSMACMVTLWRP